MGRGVGQWLSYCMDMWGPWDSFLAGLVRKKFTFSTPEWQKKSRKMKSIWNICDQTPQKIFAPFFNLGNCLAQKNLRRHANKYKCGKNGSVWGQCAGTQDVGDFPKKTVPRGQAGLSFLKAWTPKKRAKKQKWPHICPPTPPKLHNSIFDLGGGDWVKIRAGASAKPQRDVWSGRADPCCPGKPAGLAEGCSATMYASTLPEECSADTRETMTRSPSKKHLRWQSWPLTKKIPGLEYLSIGRFAIRRFLKISWNDNSETNRGQQFQRPLASFW